MSVTLGALWVRVTHPLLEGSLIVHLASTCAPQWCYAPAQMGLTVTRKCQPKRHLADSTYGIFPHVPKSDFRISRTGGVIAGMDRLPKIGQTVEALHVRGRLALAANLLEFQEVDCPP